MIRACVFLLKKVWALVDIANMSFKWVSPVKLDHYQRYAHVYGICAPSYCISLKEYVGEEGGV